MVKAGHWQTKCTPVPRKTLDEASHFNSMTEKADKPVNAGQESVPNPRLAANSQDKRVVAYFEATAANWDSMYSRKDLWGEIHQQRLSRFVSWVDKLQLPPETRVLEVGCGAGLATVALAQRHFSVEAIDVAAPMIDLARQNLAAAGLAEHAHAEVGDIYHLLFPAASFRVVLSIGVIPWLPTPGPAIIELGRVLRPGGYLLFTADNNRRLAPLLDPLTSPLLTPAKRLLKRVASSSAEATKAHDWVDSHQHSLQEVDEFLAKGGLERVYSETLGFGPFTFCYKKLFSDRIGIAVHRALQRLADLRLPLIRSTGAQFLVLARKRF